MQVRDDGSLILATHNRAYPTATVRPLVPSSCPLWVTCGRRLGKNFLTLPAALVGCGHVSGLLMRRNVPLALMLCADWVPIVSTHSKMR
jgi:hypothetical protein